VCVTGSKNGLELSFTERFGPFIRCLKVKRLAVQVRRGLGSAIQKFGECTGKLRFPVIPVERMESAKLSVDCRYRPLLWRLKRDKRTSSGAMLSKS